MLCDVYYTRKIFFSFFSSTASSSSSSYFSRWCVLFCSFSPIILIRIFPSLDVPHRMKMFITSVRLLCSVVLTQLSARTHTHAHTVPRSLARSPFHSYSLRIFFLLFVLPPSRCHNGASIHSLHNSLLPLHNQ